MSLRVGGLASVPTNKGKRTRRPSDGVVEDCGSLWRMRQHASAKKESGLLFLFALRDRSPSEHVNASHSILLFCFFLYFLFFYFRSRLQLFGVCWPDREISPLLVEPVSISGYRNTIHPSFGAWSRMCRLQTKPSKSTEQSLPRYYFPGALSRLSFFLMLQDLVYIRKSSLSWLAFSLLVRMTHQVEEETRLTACRSVPLRPMRRRVSSHRVALSSTCSLNEETIRETERKWIVAGREEGKRFADNWVVMMSSKRKEKTVKKLERTRRRLQVQKPLPVCDATRVLLNKNRWRMDLVWPLENGPKHLIAA